jgi:hypothetical protein
MSLAASRFNRSSPPSRKPHQRFYGLGNALGEQGEAVGNQFSPLPLKLGLEGRVFEPFMQRISLFVW